MSRRIVALVVLPILAFSLACTGSSSTPVAKGLSPDGRHAFKSNNNLLTNHMTRNQDGTINVVIEIPAGTSEKWEVSEDGGALVRDFTGDEPRVIDYLPFPGNYGLIPRTLLDPEKGGDGGALDAMVLGPAVPRGTVVRARPIGIIRVIDRLVQDDKILAVMDGPTLKEVYDVQTLQKRYPGSTEIIGLWWSNAHGQASQVNLMGTGSRGQANAVIDYAVESYKKRKKDE